MKIPTVARLVRNGGDFWDAGIVSSATGGEGETIQKARKRQGSAGGKFGGLLRGIHEKLNSVLAEINDSHFGRISCRFGECRETDFHRRGMALSQKFDNFIDGIRRIAIY